MSQDTQDKIESLKSQLREKEELVAALTQRLEQAAEQLDRLHRTGADRGTRVASGVPAELVEQQKTLAGELQQAVERWEKSQPEAALERLEAQLLELRDLVAGGVGHAGGAGLHAGRADQSPLQSEADSASTAASATESSEEAPASGYEAMKAALLEAPGEPQSAEAAPSSSADIQEELQKIDPVDPPEQIHLASTDLEELRRAVEERDSYIGWLIKRLRVFESCRRLPEDWEALNNVPEELQSRLESLENQLQATLRLAEVEHSLERARLSREETRIKQMEQQLQKEIRRHGLEHVFPEELEDTGPHDEREQASEDADQSEPEQSKGNRWLSFLSGRKNNESDQDREFDGS